MFKIYFSFSTFITAIIVLIHLPSFLFAQNEKDELINDANIFNELEQQYYLLGSLDGKIYYRKGFIKNVDHVKFINLKSSPLLNESNPNSHLLYENSSYYDGYLGSALKERNINNKRTVRTVIGYFIPLVGVVAGPILGSRIMESTPIQSPLDTNLLPRDSLFRIKIYKSQGSADAKTYFSSGKIKEGSHIDFKNNKTSNLFNKKNPNNYLLLTSEDYYKGFLEGSKMVKKQRGKRIIKHILIPAGMFIVGFALVETNFPW